MMKAYDKKKAAIEMSMNALVGIMLTAFMLLVAGNIFADILLNVEVTDQEELSDFKTRFDSMNEGQTYAFSFHTVPEGAEFVAFINSSDPIHLDFSAVDEGDIEAEITERSDWEAFIPIVGGGLGRIVYNKVADAIDRNQLSEATYIAQPQGCEEESSCMCIFRGLDDHRLEEDGIMNPIKTSCITLDSDYIGDAITLLANQGFEDLDYDDINQLIGIYSDRENAPIRYDDESPRRENIKLLSNVNEDSPILTIYIIRGDDDNGDNFFVVCTQRDHCEKQYEDHLYDTSFENEYSYRNN